MTTTQRRRSSNHRCRLGATAVETALAAPLLFLVFFSGLEFARANLVRNISENAALEGARAGIIPGALAEDCIAKANAELLKLKINGAVVTVDPPVISPSTSRVAVSISVPLSQNSLPLSKFVIGKTLVQSVTLTREID